MGKKIYNFTALTGGTADALDSLNGKDLNKGDMAIVTLAGDIYFYVLDNDNSSAESSPDIITPDGQNAGTKRWVLQGVGVAGAKVFNDGMVEWKISGVSEASIKAVAA